MTYSVYIDPKQIRRCLNSADCQKADTLNAGMLEQVTDDLISWHDIKRKDLNRVLDYIALEFNPVGMVGVFSEKYVGCVVTLNPVCGLELWKPSEFYILDGMNRAAALFPSSGMRTTTNACRERCP